MGSVRVLAGKGTLFLAFRYQGERCREYTALTDTATHRKRLEKALRAIEEDIAAGTFDYEKRFPGSKRGIKPIAAVAQVAVGGAPQGQAATSAPLTEAVPTPAFRTFASA